MRAKYKRDEGITQETWKTENEKGKSRAIKKGDIFNTGPWGCGGYESVLTDKNEWICDIDCKEFNEMFEIIKEE